MATTKIRGITIEIGGDTSKLTKALNDVTRELKGTQTGLKDVNKLLKFDPGNVELLRQKQAYLNDAIKDTEEKLTQEKALLEELKNTDGFDKNSEQARRLERQIAADEQALKNLKKEAKEFGSVATQQFKAVGDKLKEVGDKMTKVGDSISGVGKKLTTYVTTPILAVGTAAVKTTADFDSSMSKVQALSGATMDEFDRLRAKARQMGEQTVWSATESADAMQYMALAGWDTEQIIAGIPGVLNLATAAGEDLANVSDILTDSMTAFGLEADKSGRVADVFAKTMSSSNTTVALMGETFKYVAPVAGSLGYSMEDVALATGLMANNGIKGSMAGTSLRNIMQRMAKPTKDSADAMERLGLALYDDEGRMYSFREIMDQMRASFGEINMPIEEFNQQIAQMDALFDAGELTEKQYTSALEELTLQAYGAEGAEKARAAAMLGGARAMSGILAIVNTSEEEYNALADAINNCDGAAQDMADIMQDNLNGQMTILKSQLQELAISFGDLLIPTIRKVVTFLQNLVDKLNNMDDSQRELIIRIAAVVAAIGPVLLVGGKLIAGIGMAIKIVGAAISAIGFLIGALNPVTVVIGAVVAAGLILITNWQTVKEWAIILAEAVKEKWNDMKEGISNAVKNAKNAVNLAFTAIKADITDKINAAKDAVHNAIEKIKSFMNFQWELPHLKLPHFSISGSANPFDWITQGVPSISVDWYKKAYQNPVLFTSPTVLPTRNGYKGFGDGNGAEVVMGLNKLKEIAGETNIVFNVYGAEGQDVNQLASEIERRLVKMQKQRTAVWA